MPTGSQKFPHVVRVAFGNCLTSREMRREMLAAVAEDNSGIWDGFGGRDNVCYYVMGKDVASALEKAGAPNVRLVDDRPLVHDPSVSFWYNKTLLILRAFQEHGMDSEMLYLDCDVEFWKPPDGHLADILRERARDGGLHLLAPIRRHVRIKRAPLFPMDKSMARICPCNCLMYCDDGRVFEELLACYQEVAKILGSGLTTHWTGTTTTGEWDDESVAMYWYDKRMGCRDVATIVHDFEPGNAIRLQRHPPAEVEAYKETKLVYLNHH